MILQELIKYYERSNFAPIGLEWKEISFAIVIDASGKFVNIEDLRIQNGKKMRGKKCLVPQSEKRTVGIKSQLLWDNLPYALGIAEIDGENADEKAKRKAEESAQRKHEDFKNRVLDCLKSTDEQQLLALNHFLESDHSSELKSDPLWEDVKKSSANVSFRLQGSKKLISEIDTVHKYAQNSGTENDDSTCEIFCLATGREDKLARLHPSIKGIFGGNSSGTSIVSFNINSSESFLKEQGGNSPVGQYGATAYTTALNNLLDRQSKQKLRLGETTIVFWCEHVHPMENLLFELFGEIEEAPEHSTENAKSVYKAPFTGVIPFEEDKQKFFVLGLGANNARSVVQFWHQTTISELSEAICQYFSDINIVSPKWENGVPKLFDLLRSTAVKGKMDQVNPSLPPAILKAIFSSAPFPYSLAMSLTKRNQSEQDVTYYRAAFLKAFVNRYLRTYQREEMQMTVGLDENNKNCGYLLGRLFAVLEKIQGDAQGSLNSTIRDRYYSSASATPITAFPILMRLKNHHLAKMENKGLVVNREKLIANILTSVKDFPAHLSMVDQGRFAIGYYHQRQNFYTSATPEENNQQNQ